MPAKPARASPPPSSASRTKTGKSSAKAPSPSPKSNPSSNNLGAACKNVGPAVSAGSDLLGPKIKTTCHSERCEVLRGIARLLRDESAFLNPGERRSNALPFTHFDVLPLVEKI